MLIQIYLTTTLKLVTASFVKIWAVVKSMRRAFQIHSCNLDNALYLSFNGMLCHYFKTLWGRNILWIIVGPLPETLPPSFVRFSFSIPLTHCMHICPPDITREAKREKSFIKDCGIRGERGIALHHYRWWHVTTVTTILTLYLLYCSYYTKTAIM